MSRSIWPAKAYALLGGKKAFVKIRSEAQETQRQRKLARKVTLDSAEGSFSCHKALNQKEELGGSKVGVCHRSVSASGNES